MANFGVSYPPFLLGKSDHDLESVRHEWSSASHICLSVISLQVTLEEEILNVG